MKNGKVSLSRLAVVGTAIVCVLIILASLLPIQVGVSTDGMLSIGLRQAEANPDTVKLVGADDIATDSWCTGIYFYLCTFTAVASGSMTGFRVKSTLAGNVKCALYADNAGEPGALITAMNTGQAVTADQWNTLSFTSTPITNGVTYWLAVNTQGSPNYQQVLAKTGATAYTRYKAVTYSTFTFPDPAGTGFSSWDGYLMTAGWGETVVVPTVTTQAATSVLSTSCTGNGNIIATGGANATRRGFCYMVGQAGDPTTANSTAYDDGDYGTGTYTKSITGLTPSTYYRIRAYAINSAGTGYGDTVQVTTLPGNPASLTDTAHNGVSVDLSWTKGTGADYTLIRYRTDQYPTGTSDGTLGYNNTASTTSVGSLTYGQIYYFRAWAWNSTTTLYSSGTSDRTCYTDPNAPTSFVVTSRTSSSIALSWAHGTGADKTRVQYRTDQYPTTYTDGTQAYFNTGTSVNVTGPGLYEYYNTGDNDYTTFYDTKWVAQTFTPSITHNITIVRLKLSHEGEPGAITVSIRVTNATGQPTGGDLCIGTTDGDNLPEYYTEGEWRYITFNSTYSLSASTKYAIVVRALGADGWSDDGCWREDYTSPSYSGGSQQISTDSGSTWEGYVAYDFMFEEYATLIAGQIYYFRAWSYDTDSGYYDSYAQLTETTYEIPTAITQDASNVACTAARINGKISDDGGESCEARFRYRKTSVLYEYYNTEAHAESAFGGNESWAAQTFTPSVSHTITSAILLLSRLDEGTTGDIDVSIKATNESGHPTGIDLCSGVTDGDTLPTNEEGHPESGEWRGITLVGGYNLSADTKYAIVAKALDAEEGGRPSWWQNTANPYAGGNEEGGAEEQWQAVNEGNNDKMFEEWGKGEWATTDWQNTLVTDDTYYEDLTDLEAGTEYEFQTQVKNSCGESDWTASAYFTTCGITNIPSSNDFGILAVGTTGSTAINYFTIQNTGNCTVDVTIQGTNLVGGDDTWTLSGTATPDENIYGLYAGLDDGSPAFDVVVNATANAFISDLAEDATQGWGLKLYMPTSVTNYDAQQMSGTITLVASASS